MQASTVCMFLQLLQHASVGQKKNRGVCLVVSFHVMRFEGSRCPSCAELAPSYNASSLRATRQEVLEQAHISPFLRPKSHGAIVASGVACGSEAPASCHGFARRRRHGERLNMSYSLEL